MAYLTLQQLKMLPFLIVEDIFIWEIVKNCNLLLKFTNMII